MSGNYSRLVKNRKKFLAKANKALAGRYKWWLLLVLPAWVYAAFIAVQYAVGLLAGLLNSIGVPLSSLNVVIFNAAASFIIYILTLLVVILVPLYVMKHKTTLRLLGVDDWPTFLEILISPLAYVAYFLVTSVLVAIAVALFSLDMTQTQTLPFSQAMLGTQWQFLLAFITMVVLAPIAEELLFRGYLYGKLRKSFSIWLSVLVTSLAFGLAHLWAGTNKPLQWSVAVDTFSLSLVICAAREYTGAVWVPMMTHVIKNGIAFYLLFINPEPISVSVCTFVGISLYFIRKRTRITV